VFVVLRRSSYAIFVGKEDSESGMSKTAPAENEPLSTNNNIL
jgi:hypothetical protein